MHKQGFTLAEALITLAIIGVVAALTIPAIIVETQQSEFKTGLRKAVSVLNSAIMMNRAINNETPYTNGDLFNFLQRHMNVIKSIDTNINIERKWGQAGHYWANMNNKAFYTADGMCFEFRTGLNETNTHGADLVLKQNKHSLYESGVYLTENFGEYHSPNTGGNHAYSITFDVEGCGSYGLSNNPRKTTMPPCLITVDVNGDKKPNMHQSASVTCEVNDGGTVMASGCKRNGDTGSYGGAGKPDGSRFTDIFTIMITDSAAIPYGISAQKAMYEDNNN